MTSNAAAAPAPVDWGAVIRQFIADINVNRAPPSATFDPSSIANTLSRINAALPAVIQTLRAHQGVITGVADLLAAMSRAGVPHASDIEAAVLETPGLLAEVEEWLPWVLPVLSGGASSAPAPIGIPGGISGARGHV